MERFAIDNIINIATSFLGLISSILAYRANKFRIYSSENKNKNPLNKFLSLLFIFFICGFIIIIGTIICGIYFENSSIKQIGIIVNKHKQITNNLEVAYLAATKVKQDDKRNYLKKIAVISEQTQNFDVLYKCLEELRYMGFYYEEAKLNENIYNRLIKRKDYKNALFVAMYNPNSEEKNKQIQKVIDDITKKKN